MINFAIKLKPTLAALIFMTEHLPIDSGLLSQLGLSTEAIRQAPDLNAALELVLHQICAETPWDYAEVWLPEIDRHLLKLSPASCIKVQEADLVLALKQFRQCSEAFILQPGEGLPGYTWSSQQPQWIADVSAESETYFLRNQIAKAFGVKAGLGLPWLIHHEVVAVFVFFMQTARLADQALIRQTATLLQQLEPALTSFFQATLQKLPLP